MGETGYIPVDPDKIAEEISKRLRMERSMRNLSQEELAGMLGMTQGELSKMEHAKLGSGVLNLSKLVYVANTLKCSWEYLVTGKEGNIMNSPIVDFTISEKLQPLPLTSPIYASIEDVELRDYQNDWRYRVQYCKLNNDCTLVITKLVMFADLNDSLCIYSDDVDMEGHTYITDYDDENDPDTYPILQEINAYVLHGNDIVAHCRCYAADPYYVSDTNSNLFTTIASYMDDESLEEFEMFYDVWGYCSRKMQKNPLLRNMLGDDPMKSLVVIHESADIHEQYRNHKLFSTIRKAIDESISGDFLNPYINPEYWVEIAWLYDKPEKGESPDTERSRVHKNNIEICEHYGMRQYTGTLDDPSDVFYYRLPSEELIRRYLYPEVNNT